MASARLLALAPLVLAMTTACHSRPDPGILDILIVNGEVIDGTGAPARRDAVGIRGDRIVLVEASTGKRPAARRTIDAAGLLVAPGFIDPHTHSEADLLSDDATRRAARNHLAQGVTTVFIGNDGDGEPALAERFARLERLGIGVNVASYIGLGAVRRLVVGEADRPPTATELARMRAHVASAMCDGALGLSAGLYYAPQSYARTEEVIALAREAAARGGIYDTHLRDEGSETIGVLAALDEALAIGRAAGLPVHIAHLKALGVDAHGKSGAMIARIEQARGQGLAVTADQYPWAASGTRLANALVPRWAQDGGVEEMRRRLAEAGPGSRLHADMAGNLRRRGGASALLLTGGAYKGQTLAKIASAWRIGAVDAAIRILLDRDPAPVASFNMAPADIERFARQPWVMTSSDSTEGHPRKYGSFALRWQSLVREGRLLTPEQFVHRAAGLTAATFAVKGRGEIAVDKIADIVVFDPVRYAPRADFQDPTALAQGVRTVIVNGRLVTDDGVPTGTIAGRPLPRERQSQWSCPT